MILDDLYAAASDMPDGDKTMPFKFPLDGLGSFVFAPLHSSPGSEFDVTVKVRNGKEIKPFTVNKRRDVWTQARYDSYVEGLDNLLRMGGPVRWRSQCRFKVMGMPMVSMETRS